MNAANPLHLQSSHRQLDRLGERQAERQGEPSMEEILASIRRIIADDQAMPPLAADPAPQPVPSISPRPPQLFRGSDRVPDAVDDDVPRLAAYGQVMAPQYPSLDGPGSAEASAPSEDRDADDLGEAPHVGDLADEPAQAGGDGVPNPLTQQDKRMRDHLARDAGPDAGLGQESFVAAARDLPAEPVSRSSALFSQATDASLSSAFNMLAATRLVDDAEELRAMAREMIRPLLKEWLDDNLPSLVERLVRAEIERVARGGR